ncbi:MAG TPA: YoaK family protein [Acidimicrobiia bacterium]|nr:YoaK family protein [Acidimicrobiia bacterium]
MPAPPREPQPGIALILAGVGGWVDAVGFLTLFGLFTAHLSGNTARFGVEIGQGAFGTALSYAVPIVVFFIGVVAGVWYMSARGRQALAPLLAVEALLVTTFMVLGTVLHHAGDLTPRSPAYYGLAVAATAAMGLQTSSLRHVCHVEVHTTFVTGMITSLAVEVVGIVRHEPDALWRARIHGSLVGAYIVGAVSGSALEAPWRFWSLAIPVVVLVVLAVTRRRPTPVSATR